jgi:hypothetical protein
MTESKNGMGTIDVEQEIQELKKTIEVQAATESGAHANQAATHAGTWSTMLAGGAGLVVGMFQSLHSPRGARSHRGERASGSAPDPQPAAKPRPIPRLKPPARSSAHQDGSIRRSR